MMLLAGALTQTPLTVLCQMGLSANQGHLVMVNTFILISLNLQLLNTSSRTITEVKHLELNQFSDG